MKKILTMLLVLVAATSVHAASVISSGATVNDSSYDDTAIQSCINNNTDVYFPGGEYWIDDPITIPAGRRLHGPTSGTLARIVIKYDSGNGSDNRAFQITGDGVTIENLIIDKDYIDGTYGIGIYASGQDDITINSVEILDYSVRYGIHLVECDDFLITNCYVHDFMMNQVNPSGYEADMIDDSPAGIRVTRCSGGEISYCQVHDIEVGPNGLISYSEINPGYGPQGYQSDGITISDCSNILVQYNNIWNSGELIDLLASDNSVVSNNTLQMGYQLGVKVIGSQSGSVASNYISDASTGIYMGDHTATSSECTNMTLAYNEIVNCATYGIWPTAPSSRPGTTNRIGIYLDNNASGNTILSNNIYDYYSYLADGIRQGTGINTISGNSLITNQYGPTGGGNVGILGSWVSGLSHTKEDLAMNRALVFFTYAEKSGADIDATAVTYGGKSMTQLIERLVTEGSTRIYISAWVLKQDAINMATSSSFSVTWNTTPDDVGYSSVFLENVNQTNPMSGGDTGPATTGNTITSSTRSAYSGDLVIYGAATALTGSFTPNNGFTEALEVAISNMDGCGGFKQGAAASEYASVDHDNMGTGVILMAVMDRN